MSDIIFQVKGTTLSLFLLLQVPSTTLSLTPILLNSPQTHSSKRGRRLPYKKRSGFHFSHPVSFKFIRLWLEEIRKSSVNIKTK